PRGRLGLGSLLGGGGLSLGPAASLPPGTYAALLGPRGKVLRSRSFSYGESTPSPPQLPSRPPISTSARALRLFTVPARNGAGLHYRAMAFTAGGATIAVAVPLREVQDTLHRLVIVEALVAVGVILALVALGWLVIRIGLRPLERIGRVATEIADGDLSRRVTPTDPRTEVGRLGLSLNRMLTQIERAFTARRASERRLRQFVADASHELRTPLASIRGYAELFRIGAAEDPETRARAMARIETEAQRMGVLVEDLLALAELDQPPRTQRVAIDVRELAAQAAQDLRVTAPGREVTLRAPEPAGVHGDPEQLRRMISNLTRNAVVHTPDGTPVEIEVRTERPPAGGNGEVEIGVRDHGPGLPPGAGERLFERFWRAEPGRSRGPGGAGLGLAIVQAIAEAHGGSVGADNAVDGGAVFRVWLPAATVDDVSQESLSVLTSDSYSER
ncbi:MAG: HAMP domain-containing sensor histidine kinase, partial [Solirubrobacteraceae bacterium]